MRWIFPSFVVGMTFNLAHAWNCYDHRRWYRRSFGLHSTTERKTPFLVRLHGGSNHNNGDTSFSSDNDDNKDDQHKTIFLIIQRHRQHRQIPRGWSLANVEEAKARQSQIVESLDDWEICRLADGWKIDGPSYGGRILKQQEGEKLACQVLSLNHFAEDEKSLIVSTAAAMDQQRRPCEWWYGG